MNIFVADGLHVGLLGVFYCKSAMVSGKDVVLVGDCAGIFAPLTKSTVFCLGCQIAVFVEPRFGTRIRSF